MLSKELEILKHISELYKADVTDEDFIQEMDGKEVMVNAWREAFEGYELHDILTVIDEYFAKRNNRTPPRIAQIKALLTSQNIHPETEVVHNEIPRQTFGMEFADLDAKEGNMNWLVPEYLEVERLILADYYPFVQNIYNPSYDEFRECMKRHSLSVRGKEHQFLSGNEVKSLPYVEQQALQRQKLDINSIVKRVN